MSDLFGRIRVEQLGSGILGPPPPRGEEGNEKRDLFGRKEIIIPKEMQISCKSFESTVRENRVIFVLSSRGKKRKGKEKKKNGAIFRLYYGADTIVFSPPLLDGGFKNIHK